MYDKLMEAWAYCDALDKSTEFMLEYMQDKGNCSLDRVLKFIKNTSDTDRTLWYTSYPNWHLKYKQIKK